MEKEKIEEQERNLISKSKCRSYLNKRFIDKNGIIVARRSAIEYENDGM